MECRHLGEIESIDNTELLICKSCGGIVPYGVIVFQLFSGIRGDMNQAKISKEISNDCVHT